MSKDSKNEKEKSFPERLKRFLKSEKKNLKAFPEIKITDEIKHDLSPNASLETRLKTVRELEESIQTKKLQESSVAKIWMQTKDLLNMNNSAEVRHSVISLFSTIAATSERLGQFRLLFLKYIMDSYKSEDTIQLFNLFQCVINDGRCIDYIEEEVGPFFILWLPTIIATYPSTAAVVDLTTNLLKFNAAHIDDHIIKQMAILIINQVHQSKCKEELYSCLKFMDTLIAYVYIPSGTLTKFVSTLSRLVSIPFIVTDSWKIMRNLLRTELGNSALCALCELIESSDNFHAVRGSIYFITCALWTKQKITSLTFGPMAILPTLLRASESVHPLVIYETAISLSKLVRNHSDELHICSWDFLLDIHKRLFFFTANYSNKEQGKMIFNVMNSTVDDIEKRIKDREFRGTYSIFYDLIDCYSYIRDVDSVNMVLDYKFRALHPDQNQWLEDLDSLMHRHFKSEPRPPIRLQALSKLRYIFDKFRGTIYAEQICEEIVMKQLNEIEKDPDMAVRKAGVSLLVHMVITLHVPVVKSLLNFIKRIVLAAYDGIANVLKVYKDGEADDIYEGVKGLILVFKRKIWCLPSSFAIEAYEILMSAMELHYRNPEVLEKVPYIRKEIFEMIFDMRADADYHLGMPSCPDAQIPMNLDDPQDLKDILPKYTCFIVVDHKHGQKTSSGYSLFNESSPRSSYEEEDVPLDDDASLEEKDNESENENENEILEETGRQAKGEDLKEELSVNVREENSEEDSTHEESILKLDSIEPLTVVTHLSLTKAAMIVIVAMKKEKDWTLLKMILEKVPQVLQNKALILSKDGNDIDYLATTLCALISDTDLKIPESLHNTPPKFSKSDFDAYVYPVMASLSSYHKHLDNLYQSNIIQCLQNGMCSKSAPQCVSAMTLCVLEMRHTMGRLLREVMIRLSKISATVQNAQPTLEFLSTLLHLPRVYSNFLPSQYLSVFAIAIPYTNPFKFNHYIVSLAYHVICMWFMKCRIPHRKGFVSFISKNLNMILVNEESVAKMKAAASGDQGGKVDTELFQFHKDLRETCVDFMARNCFDSYAPETTRSSVAQMLFNRGQQLTWLVGTRIITITTSGCSKKPIKQGLCDKCVQYCIPEDANADVQPPQTDSNVSRRRHKSDFHRSVSHEVKHQPQTKDDLHMRSTQFTHTDQGDRAKYFEEFVSGDLDEKKNHICMCWCSRWAEIMIRQPTGTVSFAMRILNAQTHIVKEDLVPIQDLSSFYSPFSQGPDNAVFGKDPFFQDNIFDSYLPQPTDQIRPRASSGASDRTQTSETGLGLGEEWSNSGSGPSSGATSLASSDTKLNTRVESDSVGKDPNQLPVYHCYSSPEVNKGLMEAAAPLEEKFSKHPSLAHSMSLVEQPLKSLEQEQKSTYSSAQSSFDKPKSRLGNGAVKRCNSSVGSASPTPAVEQTNRIRHASAMQTKSCASPLTVCDKEEDPSLQPVKRGRGHTISDMNPASRNRSTRSIQNRRPTIASTSSLLNAACVTTASTTSLPSDSASTSNTLASSYSTSLTSSSKSNKEVKGGVSPSSVFLQLYYQGCFGSSSFRPILLPTQNREIERAIKVMDLVKPHEHHRIGVVYVGPGQTTEVQIFNNTSGSDRYHQFLDGLGSVYEISDFSENANLGGLDKRGVDGHLIHMWQDDLMQVVFHVATTMPNKESDPNCNNKKQHIGNDYVTIVYNNSGRPYNMNTIKSQLNHSVVEITPGDHSTNCVNLLTKPALAEFVSWDNDDFDRLVSDASLPLLGRQLAIHANLASTVWQSLKHSQSHPYATSWLEWLRKVRKLRELVLSKNEADNRSSQEIPLLQFPPMDSIELQNQAYLDFTDMIELDKAQDAKDRSRTAGFLNRR